MLDRDLYVLGDASEHFGFLNCEKISDREHIHGWRVHDHFHEGLAQLFFFSNGTVEGRVDQTEVLINSPALLWLPALCSHAFDYQEGMEGWVLTVTTTDVVRLTNDISWLGHWIDKPVVLKEDNLENMLSEIRTVMACIEREHQYVTEERNVTLEACFRLLLTYLYRSLKQQFGLPEISNGRQHQLLLAFQSLLDTHSLKQRTVTEYADLLSVTPTHLSRTVKGITGKTAGELIQDRILLEAKRRLVFSSTPIFQIADDLCFSSAAYFSRFFQKHTSQTPGVFRKHFRSDLSNAFNNDEE
ncbi:helix-turn-helix domain-containing protein [Sneathiella limimaris]|uniref:helix-turn-helix domain-containing protein n=1 Tax=Sneathiella limimaris TaxID=1964213 RepID=UPI00146CF930|nr:helix-turn-helix domain-containing protein [Sneathiella limimaris]